MLEQLKRAELAKLQQLLDVVKNLDPRHEVVVQKKKNYTWLIVLASIVAVAGIGFAVYKFFFEVRDDFEDFDDEDFEEIDYDEDYDEEFEEYDEVEGEE